MAKASSSSTSKPRGVRFAIRDGPVRFADGQDEGARPWDVRTTDAADGSSGQQVELVGASAKTPWAQAEPRPRKRRGPSRKLEEDEDEEDEEGEGGGAKKTSRRSLTEEEDEEVRKAVAAVRRARAVAESKRAAVGREDDWDLPAYDPSRRARTGGIEHGGEGEREICMRNYAAVGAGDTAVDDRGPESVPQGRSQPMMIAKHGRKGAGGHTYYGLIDHGTAQDGVRCLVMHSPPRRGRDPEDGDRPTDRVRPGSVLRVHSTAPGGGPGRLRVRFTTPERYYAPGARVSTLRIGVDASDWASLTTSPGII